MSKYLALSLGPIYQTLSQARKTRELWACSYLISEWMRILVDLLSKEQVQILSPIRTSVSKKELYGAGIFPDRLFAKVEGDIDMDNLIQKAFQELSKNLHTSQTNLKDAAKFWSQYLRIVWVIKALDAQEEQRLVLELNDILDGMEVQPTYFEQAPGTHYLVKYLDEVYQSKLASNLHNKGAYDNLMQGLFPSTSDIASLELYQRFLREYRGLRAEVLSGFDDEDEDSNKVIQAFYAELERGEERDNPLFKNFAPLHKYFCIVQADGDSFGKTIAQLTTPALVQAFSQKLADYAAEAAAIVNHYGGKPVYIGGDDLVFFAPVRCLVADEAGEMSHKTVFDLIEALDAHFQTVDFDPKPSLSFGLTITYYKYPLFEANELCRNQLVKRAKKLVRQNGVEKNALAYRFLKHSGSYFEGIWTKELLKAFTSLRTKIQGLDEKTLSSTVYRIIDLQDLIESLRDETGQINENRFNNLFDNFFNESVHKRNRQTINAIRDFALVFLNQTLCVDGKSIDAVQNAYSALRLLLFTNPKSV
jgi:CRISPR-associated protein Cmr2